MEDTNETMTLPSDPESDEPQDSTYELFIVSVTIWSLIVIVLLLFFPLPSAVRQVLQIIDFGICAVFLIDFLRSLLCAPRKMRYFLHWE